MKLTENERQRLYDGIAISCAAGLGAPAFFYFFVGDELPLWSYPLFAAVGAAMAFVFHTIIEANVDAAIADKKLKRDEMVQDIVNALKRDKETNP